VEGMMTYFMALFQHLNDGTVKL